MAIKYFFGRKMFVIDFVIFHKNILASPLEQLFLTKPSFFSPILLSNIDFS